MSCPIFGWLDFGSRRWCPVDHVSSSESLTYPGMTLVYPSKLSESLRLSNRTNLKCFDCFSIPITSSSLPHKKIPNSVFSPTHLLLFNIPILLSIQLRPQIVKQGHVHIHSHRFLHSRSSTAVRFCPLQQGLTFLMRLHETRTYARSKCPTQLAKKSFDEIIDLTSEFFHFTSN